MPGASSDLLQVSEDHCKLLWRNQGRARDRGGPYLTVITAGVCALTATGTKAEVCDATQTGRPASRPAFQLVAAAIERDEAQTVPGTEGTSTFAACLIPGKKPPPFFGGPYGCQVFALKTCKGLSVEREGFEDSWVAPSVLIACK